MTSSLMTAQDVADLLGVPASWVYEQSRLGRIPTVTLGRYRLYRLEAIEAWIEQLAPHARANQPNCRIATQPPARANQPQRSIATRDADRAGRQARLVAQTRLIWAHRRNAPEGGFLHLRLGPQVRFTITCLTWV